MHVVLPVLLLFVSVNPKALPHTHIDIGNAMFEREDDV